MWDRRRIVCGRPGVSSIGGSMLHLRKRRIVVLRRAVHPWRQAEMAKAVARGVWAELHRHVEALGYDPTAKHQTSLYTWSIGVPPAL
jgi:hypothetical protein